MLLPVEQQHQKLLIDNYSGREQREGDKARGDDAFQEDIRFGQERKNISTHSRVQSVSSTVCRGSSRTRAIQILSLYFCRFNTFQGQS